MKAVCSNTMLTYSPQKMVYFVAIFFSIFTLGVTLLHGSAFASGVNGMGDMSVIGTSTSAGNPQNMSPFMQFLEVDNDALFTPLDVSLDVISAIIMAISAFLIIKSIREYGKSTIGVALIYFFNAVLVLGAIRVIFILDDDHISSYANVQDVTEMVIWHTLFVYALLLFYIAGRTLTMLVSSDKQISSYKSAVGYLLFSAVFSIAMIAVMPIPSVQDFWVGHLQGTWFDTFGWAHLISVFLTGITAIYLIQIRDKFTGFSRVISNICIAFVLLMAIHTWELLNENWKWIIVSGNFGEFVERILWIPVFIFILVSFNQLRKITQAAPVAAEDNKMQMPPSFSSASLPQTTIATGASSLSTSPNQPEASSSVSSQTNPTDDTHQ